MKEGSKNSSNIKVLLCLIGFLLFINALTFTSANSNVIDFVNDVKDYLLEVNQGNVAGQKLIHKFGDNDNVGTTEEDIWGVGGNFNFLTSAEIMNITSADTTNDIGSGNNARIIKIFGLDENFIEIEEMVTLTATGNQTQKSYIRVFRMFVVEVGVYGNTNAGNIDATSEVSGLIQARIITGEGQTSQSLFTIPAGKTAYLLRTSITMDSGKAVHVHLKTRDFANNTINNLQATKSVHHWEGLDTPLEDNFKANHVMKEKTDLWFSGSVSSGSAVIEIDYDLLLVDN